MARARINAVGLQADDDVTLRQHACTELLRQEAIGAGLLGPDDPPAEDGAISPEAAAAIEALLERELRVPDPDDEACRRHHAAQAARYATGERARLRHVLFAVTPGVDVVALKRRAEACLIDLRSTAGTGDDRDARFAQTARELSNCPSGAEGGELGWLEPKDCAPEFGREIFHGHVEVGVLPRLVHSRFGLHVVEVLAREPGRDPPFEAVRGAVAQALRQRTMAAALQQYLRLLAGRAEIEGVDLDASATALVQ